MPRRGRLRSLGLRAPRLAPGLQQGRTNTDADSSLAPSVAHGRADDACERVVCGALTEDLPIVIEVVDSEERIEDLKPILDEMLAGGLVTLEKVTVLRYSPGPG